MNFQVPQFIEIEDKVIGPFTFKQFIYLGGAAGLAFVVYVYLPWFISFLIIPVVVIFGLALAFYQINNRPFVLAAEAALRYWLAGKLYLWRKQDKPPKGGTITTGGEVAVTVPKLSESKLRELSWSLDIKEKIQ